jgi:hypothetical protein
VTIDLPDALMRRAEASAAANGQPLSDYIADTVGVRLAREELAARGNRMAELFGALQHLGSENRRIERIIEEEFEKIDEEEWR